jgi:hypothetical protein
MSRVTTFAAALLLATLGWSHRVLADEIDDLAPGTWAAIPNTPMRAVCPPDTAEYEYSFYCKNVTAAWSGAAMDTTHGRMIVWGGGHGDYRGNEVYVFDVHALAWSRVWGPTPDAQIPDGTFEQYDDGAPSSRHTYAGLTYVPAPHDALFAMGGSKWQSGSYAVSTWSFRFETLAWTRGVDGPPSMGYGDPSVFDPQTGHIIRRTNGRVLEYDPALDVYTDRWESNGGFYQDNVATALDPDARLMVIIGDGRLDTYDVANDTYEIDVAIEGPGVVELFGNASPGFDFDGSQGRFVVWGGALDLYTYDPELRTFTVHEMAGDDPGPVFGSGGAFGRFRYAPTRNAFVWVGGVDANVFVVRMTDGTGVPPEGEDTGSTGEEGSTTMISADTSSTSASSGDSNATSGSSLDGVGEPSPGSTSSDDAASNDEGTGGCGCSTRSDASWASAWLVLALACRRRRLWGGLALFSACGNHEGAMGSADLDSGTSDAASTTASSATSGGVDPSAGASSGEDSSADEGSSSGDSGGDDGSVQDDTPFLLYDGEGGVTRDWFNAEAALAWTHMFGDWRDAEGTLQGEVPIAMVTVEDLSAEQVVEIDLGTALTDEEPTWLWEGVLLRVPEGGESGITVFHSREAADPTLRPKLVLTDAAGTIVELAPAADVHVDGSTSNGIGTSATIRVSGENNAMLRFSPPDPAIVPTAAKLVLTTTESQYGAATIGAYFLVARKPEYLPVTTGLAAEYPQDDGIADHPDVFMATRFANGDSCEGWTSCSHDDVFDGLTSDAEPALHGFEALDGPALRVHYEPGDLGGGSQTYDFVDAGHGEQDEVYFRYYLRFSLDFVPIVDGGKMPGISGDNSLCGNGGSPSDGKCGWTLRGSFKQAMTEDNPMFPRQVLGTYAYHGHMQGDYGDGWRWQTHGLGAVELARWVCVEQHVRVNTPGVDDGVLEVWIDGYPAYARTDVFLRDVPPYTIDGDLGVRKIWSNHYHGGTSPTTVPLTLYMDNVVVAKSRIGCAEGL